MKENPVEKVQSVEKSAELKLPKKGKSVRFWRTAALVLIGITAVSQLFSIDIAPKFNFFGLSPQVQNEVVDKVDVNKLQAIVNPAEGVELPIAWNDLGKRMIADGVIDETKFRALFEDGLTEEEERIFTSEAGKVSNESIVLVD